MDIERLVDTLKQPVESFEPGVILPAVDVLVIQCDDMLPQFLDGVAGDAGLARSRGAVQERCFGVAALRDRAECIGQVAHLVGSMLHVTGDKLGL